MGGEGRGGEMTQILYAHMNKIKIKKKNYKKKKHTTQQLNTKIL
jgi:hypothetical protein